MPRRGSDLRHSRSLVSLKSVRMDSVADLVADTTAGFCLNSIRASFARKGPADFVTLCGAMDIGAGLADMCVVVDVEGPLEVVFRAAVFRPPTRGCRCVPFIAHTIFVNTPVRCSQFANRTPRIATRLLARMMVVEDEKGLSVMMMTDCVNVDRGISRLQKYSKENGK